MQFLKVLYITSKKSKLDGAELEVSVMLLTGISVNQMAKLYGTHRKNVKLFISKNQLDTGANLAGLRGLMRG